MYDCTMLVHCMYYITIHMKWTTDGKSNVEAVLFLNIGKLAYSWERAGGGS